MGTPPDRSILLGAHMSIAGGLHLAPERGKKADCGVIQIFTKNPNQWLGKPSTGAEAWTMEPASPISTKKNISKSSPSIPIY